MTDELRLQQVELAQGYLTQLKNLIYEAGISFIEIGRLLKIFRDEKLYKALGEGGYDNFRQFLAGAEVGISPSAAYALIGIYETYVLKFGYKTERLATIPWTRLQALTATVKHKKPEEAEEWIEKAATLGSGDFMTEIREARANNGWEHPLPFPRIYRCKDCQKWRIEVDPANKCTCIDQ